MTRPQLDPSFLAKHPSSRCGTARLHVGEAPHERSLLLFLLSVSERLMDTLLVSGPFLVAQHELLYLPSGGLGQVAEFDGCGALKVCQSSSTEFDNLCFGRVLAWLQCDEDLGSLAPLLIWDGDHRALHNGGLFFNRPLL